MYKKLIIIFISVPFLAVGQNESLYKYINGNDLTVSGRSPTVDPQKYYRIDTSEWQDLPSRVRELSTHSAGINIIFQTNSTSIKVNWKLKNYKIQWNMSPLAVNGLDLYGWNGESWQYVSSAKPSDTFNSATFISNMEGKMRHYKVYLPLYTGLEQIEIGVEEKAEIRPAEATYISDTKVVIYGSSITQGASASRPGMAYPSIMERKLDVETFNLGFSGSGKMEIAMATILGSMEADLYILDCVPNPSPEEIKERAVPFVKRLRELKPDVPILMVESIFRENGNWDFALKERILQQNESFKMAFSELERIGFQNLYYIPSDELIGDHHESTADGVHLSDLGFFEIAERIGQSIEEILKKNN